MRALRVSRRRFVSASIAALLAVTAGASAYFSSTGSGSAAGVITTLSVPASPAATSAGSSVSVTWNASTINGSVAATSYAVERYNGSGQDLGAASCSPVPSSSGNPNAFGSFSCTDSPGGGTYKYTIAAKYNTAWTATTGFTNTVTTTNSTTTTVAAPASDATNAVIAASSISSVLSGATSTATGTITFKVFGPQSTAPTTCTTGGTTVGTATVVGNSTYHPLAGYTPTSAGTYWWYASYGGDANNAASASICGTGMTSTAVSNSTTTTVAAPATDATNTAIAASSISSILSGATSSATGTITFKVFGPQTTAPTTCTTGGTTVGTATVAGNSTYHPSAGYSPTSAGTYWWYASYGGDASNTASASTCGTGMTSTVVSNKTTTTVAAPATDATNTAIAASSISSVLSGATSTATGTITFKVFGPQSTAPTTCTSGGTSVGTAPVVGNGTYHPLAGYTPTSAGTYWWYASYGGDASNTASASKCGTGMTSTVVTTTPFVGASTAQNGASGATTLTISKPAGTVSGDVEIATVAVDGGVGSPPTAPSGWTQIQGTTSVGFGAYAAYYHVAGASEPSSYTWTLAGYAVGAAGGIDVYGGENTSTPIQTSALSTGNGTSASAPSVTTTAANERIVVAAGYGYGGSPDTAPAGTTDRGSVTAAYDGPITNDSADFTQVTAGATAAEVFTLTSSTNWATVTIALTPA